MGQSLMLNKLLIGVILRVYL